MTRPPSCRFLCDDGRPCTRSAVTDNIRWGFKLPTCDIHQKLVLHSVGTIVQADQEKYAEFVTELLNHHSDTFLRVTAINDHINSEVSDRIRKVLG